MEFNDDDIRAITESIWSAILALEVIPAPPGLAPADDPDWLIGVVTIRGAWNGTVLVHCPAVLARQAAAVMFDVDPAEATAAQIEDAVCEVTNMTGGNIKSLLPETCWLELPRILRNGDRTSVLAATAAAHVGFECGASPFSVSIHEDHDLAATVAATT